jgi:hypothetical protein
MLQVTGYKVRGQGISLQLATCNLKRYYLIAFIRG